MKSRDMICLLLAVSASSGAALAETDAVDAKVEEVLVVGARLPRPVQDVVGTVDVISRDALLDAMAMRASDIVRYTPGVSVAVADSRFGESEYTIRGLSGNRVVQLIDGVRVAPQFDVGAFSNATQDYYVPDAIARVEILRGPASSLFGSDALGGVVAVVTRDPTDFLGGEKTRVTASTTYSGADAARVFNVSGAMGGERTSAVLHLSNLDGHELDHSAPGADDQLDRRRDAALVKVDHALRSGNRLRLRAEAFRESVDSDLIAVLGYGSRYRNTTSLMGDDERDRYSLVVGYEFGDLGIFDEGRITAYYETTDVEQATYELREFQAPPVALERIFEYDHRHAGLLADFESTFASGKVEHRLGWGVVIDRSELEEARDGMETTLTTGATTNVLLGEVMPVRDFPNSEVTEIGAYVHDEISFGRWAVIPALRIDSYDLNAKADAIYREDNPAAAPVDVDEFELSPKLGVRFAVNETTALFGQYAHGFRAPPFEDANIGLDIPRFNIRAIPNPDLRAESSDGIELGIRHRGDRSRSSFAVFGATYDDFIETKVNLGPDPDTGVILFQSRNIDEAWVYGVEFESEFDATDTLSFGLAANWTRGENRADHEPLNTVDPAELVARLDWRAREWLRLQWITTAVAAQDRVDESSANLVETSSFTTSDVLAHLSFDVGRLRDVRMDIGLFNVFDKTYWRWSSVRNRLEGDPLIGTLSAPGRYASASLRVSL